MSDGQWPNEPVGVSCKNCDERPATCWWTGELGADAANRGYAMPWCKLCALRAQLDHAEQRAAAITELKSAVALEEASLALGASPSVAGVKQVILLRKDLRNRRGEKVKTGKLGAQIGHAASYWLRDRLRVSTHTKFTHTLCLSDIETAWFLGPHHAKIVLAVHSEVELRSLCEKAEMADLLNFVVVDEGRTEFEGKTITCAAIGPNLSVDIDKVTGHLETY